MRAAIMGSVALIGLFIPAAAIAQTASRSADDIISALDPNYREAETIPEDQMPDRPAQAGFTFSKPKAGAQAPAAPKATERKGGSTQLANVTGGAKLDRASVTPKPPRSGIDMRITFGLGSAEMTPQGRAEAAVFAKALTSPRLAGKKFLVEGHTDAIGDRDYNLKLSQERADAVAAYLRSLGVDGGRIQAKGFGFDKPLPNVPRASAANRRVQFVPIG